MKKLELFLKAMEAGEFRRTAWVVSGFALIKEDENEWRKDPYAFRIVQTNTGHFYVDPDKAMELSPVIDGKAGEPLYTMKDRIDLKPGDIANLKKPVNVPLGNVIVNWLCLVWPFGDKVEFLTGKITPKLLENIVRPLLQDTPVEEIAGLSPAGVGRDPSFLYVDEYLKFCDAAFFLPGFTQLCVPSATAKTMTSDPRIPALKAKLIEENKDRLHDPAVVAKIMAELVAVDKEWLKDDMGADFYAVKPGKLYNIARAKMYLMHGAEVGLEENVEVSLIQNALVEGWDISKFPEMNDSLRAGSFNRGHQTMLGGESVKWLLRASVNMSVTGEDCGSVLGMPFNAEGANYKKLIGYWVVQGKGSVEVTEENAISFADKDVLIRSPMYCKFEKTDFCAHCVGKLLATNPNGLSIAIAEYGSAFLGMFLALAHGKALLLAKMDWRKCIT